MEQVLDMDAGTLARKIRNRQISSLEATKTYIDHIKEVNPSINCMVEDNFDQALRQAERFDKLLAKGNPATMGRLFGVPISMKECFDVAQMKTTGGLLHRKEQKAQQDSEIVSRLNAEGAIIICKTNTPTLCFCQETQNKLYGTTNNPWKLSHTAGGSSGGEAALVAVGGAAVGIGSDIGGSLRFPGHFNGVVTFKSGNGQVSPQGHFPSLDNPLQLSMLGIGAVAKSVDDAQLINEILAGSPPDVDIDKFSLIIPPKHPKYPLDEATETLIDDVRAYFTNNSKQVSRTFPPMFEDVATMWQLAMSIDGAAAVKETATPPGKTYHPLREFIKERLFGNTDWHYHLSWALFGAAMFKPSAAKLNQLHADVENAIEENNSFLQEKILILPVYYRPAPKHGKLYAELFSISKSYTKYMPYIAYANTLGLPALTVPVGDSEGLPIALQVIGSAGSEKAIFHYGRMLTAAFRGYKRCTDIEIN